MEITALKKKRIKSRELTLDILELLMKKKRTIDELIEVTGASDESIRRHLKTLEEYGFAFFIRNRYKVWYSCIKQRDQIV